MSFVPCWGAAFVLASPGLEGEEEAEASETRRSRRRVWVPSWLRLPQPLPPGWFPLAAFAGTGWSAAPAASSPTRPGSREAQVVCHLSRALISVAREHNAGLLSLRSFRVCSAAVELDC